MNRAVVPVFSEAPAVSMNVVCIDGITRNLEAATSTQIGIEYEPLKVKTEFPPVLTEGSQLCVTVSGEVTVSEAVDPCHLLNSCRVDGNTVRARLCDGLLEAYGGFGRLGLMDFARRTFFVRCSIENSADSVLLPIDITILPGKEAAFTGDLQQTAENATAMMTVRNNDSEDMTPMGSISMGCFRQGFMGKHARGHSEQTVPFSIPLNRLALVSPGENDIAVAAVSLRENRKDLHAVLTAQSIFESGPLAAHAASRMTQIALPEDKMMPDTDWRKLRDFPGFPHVPWSNSPPALEKLEGQTELAPPELPQVKFALPQRKFVPVSWKMGCPSFTLDLSGRMVKKLYVLVIPYLENHDMFAEVARMTVRGDKGAVLYTRTLRTPGDLDWWPSAEVFGDVWTTAHHGRADRHGLLPMLKEGETDWPMAHPPAFPQPEYWATCLPIITGSCTMNVVELDLRTLKPVQSLVIETLGANPALGVVAVTAEGPGDDSLLDGTPWEVPAERRQPRTIFTLNRPESLGGWELTGDAFSVCAVPSLFTASTLNSLGKAGEQATGTAMSPVFEIRPADKMVVLDFQGGRSVSEPEGESLSAEIIEADTGKVLGQALPPASHLLQPTPISIQVDKPTQVRLRLTDRNTENTFAWIGVSSVRAGANLAEPMPLWN
jgi:hypothetical protein